MHKNNADEICTYVKKISMLPVNTFSPAVVACCSWPYRGKEKLFISLNIYFCILCDAMLCSTAALEGVIKI